MDNRVAYEIADRVYSIWWQMALGIFLGMLGHSIIVGLYAQHQTNKMIEQLNAETAKMERQARAEMAKLAQPPSKIYIKPAPTAPIPLKDGERCIQGRRFRRVENGWIQLPYEPC